MIWLTTKIQKRKTYTWRSVGAFVIWEKRYEQHVEKVQVTTLWILFLPIWTRTKVIDHNL